MSSVSPSAVEQITDVQWTVILSSDKISVPLNITNTVSDIDIYEHIEKPYLTGVIGFMDSTDLLGSVDFGGGEKLEITFASSQTDGANIKKIFYIDKIISSDKVNGTNEYIICHILEDIAFESNLLNVNKAYKGTGTKICANISAILGREFQSSSKDAHEMRVIIPNLTPLNALNWIKNKTTTQDGYPYYLFSPLQQNALIFHDLESMMTAVPMNPKAPYTYSESDNAVDGNQVTKRRKMLSYKYSKTEDLFSIIDAGHIGSKHQYFNVTKNTEVDVKFDVVKDVIAKMKASGIVTGKPLYTEDYKLDGKPYNIIESRITSQIGGTSAYEDYQTFSERVSEGKYRLDVAGRAMVSLVKKSPLTFVVNGVDFFSSDRYNTVGRKLRLRFLSNSENEENPFDSKKSGDYLLFSAKHSFKPELYSITFTGVKLDNSDV